MCARAASGTHTAPAGPALHYAAYRYGSGGGGCHVTMCRHRLLPLRHTRERAGDELAD